MRRGRLVAGAAAAASHGASVIKFSSPSVPWPARGERARAKTRVTGLGAQVSGPRAGPWASLGSAAGVTQRPVGSADMGIRLRATATWFGDAPKMPPAAMHRPPLRDCGAQCRHRPGRKAAGAGRLGRFGAVLATAPRRVDTDRVPAAVEADARAAQPTAVWPLVGTLRQAGPAEARLDCGSAAPGWAVRRRAGAHAARTKTSNDDPDVGTREQIRSRPARGACAGL